MIILITGASHTGKTLLAQKLLEKYKYPYVSMDHIKMGLIRSGYTGLTPEEDGELTEYLWPVIREMMKTAIENKQNLILEGCYVPFDWRKDLDAGYLTDIRFICLGMTSDFIDKNLGLIRKHASDVEARQDDSDCTADRLKEDNRKIIEGFIGSGEQVTLIEDEYERVIGGIEF